MRVADYQVPARIRRLRIEDRQPLPGLSVVKAERRLDFLSAGDGLINATYADTRRFPPYPQVITDFVSAATAGGLSYTPYRGDPGIAAIRSVALVIKSGRIVFAENPSLLPAGL